MAAKRLKIKKERRHRPMSSGVDCGYNLGQIFNNQISILKERGVPEQIIERFNRQREAVIRKAGEMDIGEKRIPFLPVIRLAYSGYSSLLGINSLMWAMSMVRNGNKKGYCRIEPSTIINKVRVPDGYYYIYGVRIEEGYRITKTIDSEPSSPLTLTEAISLCIVTDVFSWYDLCIVGSFSKFIPLSRYRFARMAPIICLGRDGRPQLDWMPAGSLSHFHWGRFGIPFCSSRS